MTSYSYTKAKDGGHPCVQLSRVSLNQVTAEHKRSEPGERARDADSVEEVVFAMSWMGAAGARCSWPQVP